MYTFIYTYKYWLGASQKYSASLWSNTDVSLQRKLAETLPSIQEYTVSKVYVLKFHEQKSTKKDSPMIAVHTFRGLRVQ